MKKLLTLALAVALLFCMVGCGEELPSESEAIQIAQSMVYNNISDMKTPNEEMYHECDPSMTEYEIDSIKQTEDDKGKCWEIIHKITLNTPANMCCGIDYWQSYIYADSDKNWAMVDWRRNGSLDGIR